MHIKIKGILLSPLFYRYTLRKGVTLTLNAFLLWTNPLTIVTLFPRKNSVEPRSGFCLLCSTIVIQNRWQAAR